MNREAKARGEKRYIGLDVHKRYVTVGGMNAELDVVLRPRDVMMERFRSWAEQTCAAVMR